MKRLIVVVFACLYFSPAHAAVDCEAKPGHPQCNGDSDLEARVEALENLLRPKIVFVTSTTYSGNLGGLAGADAECQAQADSASLLGTFKAWISDSTTDATDTARFTRSIAPYLLPDGTLVANNFNHLVSGHELDHEVLFWV